MSDALRVADAVEAARLVALGMRPKLLPARDLVYAELVRRYQQDPVFADLVEAVASGLGLAVLAVSPRTGAVLAAMDDSVFEVRIDEYARRAGFRERRDLEKALHGLIHLAIAALAFPRPDDLADDSYVGRVSVDQVDGVVREACRVLAARTEENQDPPADEPDLETAWRAYARRPGAAVAKDGTPTPDSTRGMIGKALRFLADHGFLVRASTEGSGTYRTTPRYQVQVREVAAERAFGQLLDLGVVPVTDPAGSLRRVGSDRLA